MRGRGKKTRVDSLCHLPGVTERCGERGGNRPTMGSIRGKDPAAGPRCANFSPPEQGGEGERKGKKADLFCYGRGRRERAFCKLP